MSTGRERRAANARQAPKRRCSSLAQQIDAERLWPKRCQVPRQTAPGREGQTVDEVKQDFGAWREATRRAVHTQGYRPPPERGPDIPTPGKREHRPLGVPCVGDRVRRRSVADILAVLYGQDVVPCAFGGRPGVGAHHALATLDEQAEVWINLSRSSGDRTVAFKSQTMRLLCASIFLLEKKCTEPVLSYLAAGKAHMYVDTLDVASSRTWALVIIKTPSQKGFTTIQLSST